MKDGKVKNFIVVEFKTILVISCILFGLIFTDRHTKMITAKKQMAIEQQVIMIQDVPEVDVFSAKQEENKNDVTKKDKDITKKTDSEKPMISAPEMTVYQNAQINIYDGVTAIDDVDGDVTSGLVASSDLDTSTIGTYTIQFSVTDKSGNVGVAERVFYVIANEEIQVDNQVIEQEAQGTIKEHESSAPAPVKMEVPAFSPMSLIINGVVIPYQNGGQSSGQSIIDANPNGTASTWGGAAIQSATDGLNTHFIGHNPGIFAAIFSLTIGSEIIVTDAAGTPTSYIVQTQLQLDDYGDEISTGTSYWDLVLGSGGGERITLQTCITEHTNLITIAYKR